MSSLKVIEAREAVVRATLRYLSAERPEYEHAFTDAESCYAQEQLAIAARDLFNAVDNSEREDKPIGW